MNNELYHFGVKGMKWGVRRYQNPDGSLTEEGKLHYDENGKKLTRSQIKQRRDTIRNTRYSKTFMDEIHKDPKVKRFKDIVDRIEKDGSWEWDHDASEEYDKAFKAMEIAAGKLITERLSNMYGSEAVRDFEMAEQREADRIMSTLVGVVYGLPVATLMIAGAGVAIARNRRS